MTKITGIYIYPVKSMAGIALKSIKLDDMGLKHDRHWMVVDHNGHFVTQRQVPLLTTIKPSIEEDHLSLLIGNRSIRVQNKTEVIKVKVWESELVGHRCNDEVNEALSGFLNGKYRLVHFGPKSKREKKTDNSLNPIPVSFVDGYPIHIINERSVDQMIAWQGSDISLDRFRANLIITHDTAFAEDAWSKVNLPNCSLEVVKQTARCTIPSINQRTGNRDNDVVRTMAKHRKDGNKTIFGIYCRAIKKGEISIGENLTFS